ncbi:MAG: hypothetical protein ABIW85_10640 [Variovorax sp.]
MSLAGTGAVAIWHDLLPSAKDAFYEWHNREHMPERTAVPGFVRGRRYIALSGTPEYFNLYEASNPEVLSGPDYLARLNAPTPWTREVVASFRNVARSVCRVAYSAGVGQGGVMATLRFDVPADAHAHVADSLCSHALPPLANRVGICGVHLCLTDEATSNIQTTEKKARANATLVPTWIVLIEGGWEAAVDAAAVKVETALGAALIGRVLDRSIYRLEHERGETPAG